MAMPAITFDVFLFRTPEDRKRSQRCVLWLMEALTQINVTWIKSHPDTPPLYEAGIVYEAEPPGQEVWQDVPTLIERRKGDCEDLACYRAAELRAAGINVRPYIKWRKEGDGYVYHAVLMWPDGRVEDPSLALGMADGMMFNRPMFIGA